ncbi:MAG: hypothetical protein HYT12_00275 [Candidatus Liptonbacteria bacterium]|nr:hypothetical protein [Candidatus Liptonbacteria bacterium]
MLANEYDNKLPHGKSRSIASQNKKLAEPMSAREPIPHRGEGGVFSPRIGPAKTIIINNDKLVKKILNFY